MCQATVYLNSQEIMKDVLKVEVTTQGVRLSTFFEPPQVLQASVREIDFLKHRVMLEPLIEDEIAP